MKYKKKKMSSVREHERGPVLLVWVLVLLFAGLMSVPFLVPHCGFFSLFGIVPLLMMERIVSLSGMRRGWIYHYSAFVLWNAATTFWVCNATVGGGFFAVFANAFQMSLIFGLFRFSKKYFKGILPYIFLAAGWIAWEHVYFDAQISWPWLVLGNSFARSIESIQWYEFTGHLGGSLWIWTSNLLIFGLMVALSDGSWQFRWNIKAKIAMVSSVVLVIAAPLVISKVMFDSYQEKEDPLEVLILQPNIDPYNKFQAMSQDQQNVILLDQIRRAIPDRKVEAVAGTAMHSDTSVQSSVPDTPEPLLIVAPETFTNDVVTNNISSGRTFRRFVSFLKDYPGVNMLFGASSYTYIDSPEPPSYTARKVREGRWVESHNSALMMDGTGRNEIFHKSKLVPAVEMTPYPDFFCKIDDLLGGVMGRCVGQDSITVLHCVAYGFRPAVDSAVTPPDVSGQAAGNLAAGDVQPGNDSVNASYLTESIPVGCAVCYESVYGDYYTGYVRAGAEVMTVITNDAWWKDTPGYRQHLSYASLRAIETRRSIARSANTGISAIVNQRGEIVERTAWWEPAVIRGTLNRNDKVTFFVEHGDIAGRVSSFVFILLFAALFVRLLIPARRR
ncbi:MAG: apolipoprotein N-acyltransferase [Bacteroidetes bacterium]|uniref:Apolipoprotein N-acyltransferase n=1 Tax=Candidatus Cryptobacteroides merdavium TaxID=2840769 RepID=A0A9D9HAF9_9BACT|nr:apolipoprotein N-acyltransferase [Candidatus Cryptobacteroides merdavium]